MLKLNISKTKLVLSMLAAFSALFFGLVSLFITQVIGDHYIYLLSLPIAIVIGLVFLFDRYFFFLLVILTRSSLDVVFNSIKLGSFGIGAVLNALVILIAILTIFEKPNPIQPDITNIKRAWIIFLTLSFLSLTYSPAVLQSVKVFLIYVSYASMFLLGTKLVNSQSDFDKWIKVVALSSIIPVLYGLFCIVFGGRGMAFSYQEGFRLRSTFPHPNPFAPYLVLMITVCFYIYKSKITSIGNGLRKTLPLYILLLVAMLIMTKTRSGWVACYMFFFLYAVMHERKYLFIVILAPFVALLIPEVQERVLDLTSDNDFGSSGYGRLNSYAWRLKIWSDSLAWMSKTHYLTGYGLYSFIHHSTSFAMANAFQKQDFDINAHNIYVQLFFELGIFGLLAFLYLMFEVFKKLLRVYKFNRLLVFTVIVMLLEFAFMGYADNLLDYLVFNWYLWFTLGLTISASRLFQKPEQDTRPQKISS